MKKLISIFLVCVMLFSISITTFAANKVSDNEKLSFNADGKFKIMMVNDTQDVGFGVKRKMVNLLNAALDAEKPDLVVFVGDQLSDVYPFAGKKDFKRALDNILAPLETRKIPFLVTMGNHDHDRESKMIESEQYEIYNSYSMCMNTENGPEGDPFTCSKLIYGTDGSAKFNIYMMDTNSGSIAPGKGIHPEQLDWYNKTFKANKELNGKVIPSLLFQHIPCKEIYYLLNESTWDTEGSVYSTDDNKWYCLNPDLYESGTLGESPCPEEFSRTTGQYQAWVENGDIMGAFFAHDHLNSFVGTTKDGIRMGYNSGAGFKAYGDTDKRSVRIFELDENDVENYTTRLVTYGDLIGKLDFVFNDLITLVWVTDIMRVIYKYFGWAINLFSK